MRRRVNYVCSEMRLPTRAVWFSKLAPTNRRSVFHLVQDRDASRGCFFVTQIQAHTGVRVSWPQLLEEQRPGSMIKQPNDASSAERIQYLS